MTVQESTRFRPCQKCGKQFYDPRSDAKKRYCSPQCRRASYRLQMVPTAPPEGVCAGTIGALHELLVTADLLRRGFHVFRAVSPSCPCDLIAYREQEPPIRIEVRTTQRLRDGSLVRRATHRGKGKQDVFALVTHDGCIEYVPDGLITARRASDV